MFILFFLTIIIIGIGFYFITILNQLNRAKIKIEEAQSSIEIMLDKRYNVLSESLKVVKSFVEHENEVFSGLIQVNKNSNIDDLNKVLESQNLAMDNLIALGQRYPDLKSSASYLTLQTQLSEENEFLVASKRAYNSNITIYNDMVVSIPSSIVATCTGNKKKEYIKEEDLEMKKNFKLNL